jgi:hypothetical protein
VGSCCCCRCLQVPTEYAACIGGLCLCGMKQLQAQNGNNTIFECSNVASGLAFSQKGSLRMDREKQHAVHENSSAASLGSVPLPRTTYAARGTAQPPSHMASITARRPRRGYAPCDIRALTCHHHIDVAISRHLPMRVFFSSSSHSAFCCCCLFFSFNKSAIPC